MCICVTTTDGKRHIIFGDGGEGFGCSFFFGVCVCVVFFLCGLWVRVLVLFLFVGWGVGGGGGAPPPRNTRTKAQATRRSPRDADARIEPLNTRHILCVDTWRRITIHVREGR